MGKRLARATALTAAGVVVAAGAGTAYAELSASGPAYRLASVASADVTSDLQVVGTLTPERQASVSFPVDGTVASVAVTAGQRVAAGQLLGAVDTAPLKASLASAQSTLATANLRVHNDLASQDAAAATTAATTPAGPSLRPLQQAVLAAQRAADRVLGQARTALAQAARACPAASAPDPAATPSAPGPAPAPSGSRLDPTRSGAGASAAAAAPAPSPTGTVSPAPAPTPSPTASPAPSAVACARATQRVLAAETVVLHAQQALSRQLTALSAALSGAAGTRGQQPGRASDPAGGSAGGAGQPVSAAQLAADQAAADAAAAQVTVAQQDLANADVVSPISGTVVGVDVTPGAAVSAGSTAFEVAGLGTYQVVTTVPVTDMPELRAGQHASVRPDGLSAPISGAVVSIGLMPDTSVSPATYPVTIGLTGPPSGLHAGGLASVTITTGHGSGVSVPTSAVHQSGRSATVIVLAGGKARVTRVTVGTKGPVWTRITAGLRIGQQVVLADLSKPLPTTNLPGLGGPGGPGQARFVVAG
jgi:HlyD family secretion protein